MNRSANFLLAICGVATVCLVLCYAFKAGPFAIDDILSEFNNPNPVISTPVTPTVAAPAAPAATPKDTEKLPEFGIGIEVGAAIFGTADKEESAPVKNRKGNPMVLRVLPGSPAERAGLAPGDGIISVREQGATSFARFTRGMTLKQLMKVLRGTNDSIVIVEVDGLAAPVEIKRGELKRK